MKKIIYGLLALGLMACSGNKTAENTQEAEVVVENAPTIVGKWRLVDYAGEDQICEMDSTQDFVIEFMEDNNFGMTTDCNTIGGQYVVNGDSIRFDNLLSTKMACPSENVEVAMSGILPRVDTYAVLCDTILNLRSDMRTMARFNRVND